MSTPFVSIADIVAAVEETRAMGRGLRGLNTWAIDSIVADWHRLRVIEAAAIEVLATGQARYDVLRSPTDPEGFLIPDESAWVGDLVPAVAMIALRAAVDGETPAPLPCRCQCPDCGPLPGQICSRHFNELVKTLRRA